MVLVVLTVGARLYVNTDAGRAQVMAALDGLRLSRFGRLKVYGLRGDLLDDFTVERATVSDARGVWLEVRDLHVDWTVTALLRRLFHAEVIEAGVVRLIRQPIVEPPTSPPKPQPISVDIERFASRLELMEGFSQEYGRWTLAGRATIDRGGRRTGEVDAKSLTRAGDYLRGQFDVGGRNGMKAELRAFEASGGPIAGSLGYPTDRPFSADATASGRESDGRFDVRVLSGGFSPLSASGRWDGRGAKASGHASFSESGLLKPFAEKIGVRASFGLSATQVRGDLYTVGWVLDAENLQTRAQGVVNAKRRSAPQGLALIASVKSLTRLVGQPVAGPAAFDGAWSGELARWRLQGDLSARQLAQAGYTLASARGPIDLRANQGAYDLKADLTGAGGGGQGLLAGMLGAAPRVRLDASRLGDGRLLVRDFEAIGSGAKVRAEGSRGLGGGLTVRGDATLTNAAVIRPEARGEVAASFRASQPRGSQRWAIDFDARGRRFVTGYPELDRLLGPEPRLRADGGLSEGRIAINSSQLNGRAGRASAKGLIGLNGDLKLALDWSAQGPFRAGPVEIAGNARGDGSVTGSLASPRADLKARFDAIDLKAIQLTDADVTLAFRKDARATDGRITIAAQASRGDMRYGAARAASDFRFTDGVRLENLDVDAAGLSARGAVALRNGAASSADLTFTAGPGAFVESGTANGRIRLTDGGADTPASVDITATRLKLRGSAYRFRTLRLNGVGTLSRLPFVVSADVTGPTPVRFEGTGALAMNDGAQAISLNGQGRVRRADFRTNEPIQIALAGERRTVRLDLAVGGGRLVADGRQGPQEVELRANLTSVNLGLIGEDLEGRVDAALALNGRGATLTGSLDADLEDARSLDGPRSLAVDGRVRARLADQRLNIEAAAFDEGGVNASTTLELPVEASAAPLRLAVARTRPLQGRFDIRGEVRPVWDLLLGGDRSLSGQVNAQGTLGGTLNDLRADGQGSLAGGRFEDSFTGLELQDLALNARFDDRAVVMEQFSARDGQGGSASGQGRIELRRGGASSFTVQLNRFRLIDNEIGRADASGPVTATRGADGGINLTGKLRVDSAQIEANPPTPSGVVSLDVIEINKPGPADAEEEAERPQRSRGPRITLDVDITAPRQVFVRGRGLDVELSLNAHVGGSVTAPDLSGAARVVRGDFEFAGRRFEFDERGSITLDENPRGIRLDLRAVREDPTLTAVVRVEGTAAEPRITLTSTPSLPQDEILAQVLFGRSASQLSGVEAAQLAAAVASLARGGGFDVIGNLREFAGLDRLSFMGDASGGLSVAGGKYLSEDVYLEVIGGGREGPAVQVEWRVRRSLSILSRVTGQGDTRLSVRWRRDVR
jgi:translocation and assembly module TamB